MLQMDRDNARIKNEKCTQKNPKVDKAIVLHHLIFVGEN